MMASKANPNTKSKIGKGKTKPAKIAERLRKKYGGLQKGTKTCQKNEYTQ